MPDRNYYLQKDNENFQAARGALPGYIERMVDELLRQAGEVPA